MESRLWDDERHQERFRLQSHFKITTSPGRQHSKEPLHCRLLLHVVFGMTECWHWCGSVNAQGYGRMTYQNRLQFAHRLSYQAFLGLIPEGMSVLHKCDNPSCINPGHLFLGTYSDNIRDAWVKGRQKGRTGMLAPNRKITPEVAGAICAARADTGDSYAKLGQQFGLAAMTVYNVVKGIRK